MYNLLKSVSLPLIFTFKERNYLGKDLSFWFFTSLA